MKKPASGKRDERRGGDRAKVRKVGRIVVEDPRWIYSCILLDISDTGALLLVHDKVPERFGLFYSAKRLFYEVVVVRRHQDTLGVRFEGEGKVLSGGDKLLEALRGS